MVTAGFCAGQPQNLLVLPCPQGIPAHPSCTPSKKESKEAGAAFSKGLKLRKTNHAEEALDNFETAARLAPTNVEYVTARELTRQQMVSDYLKKGNAALLGGKT